MFSTAAGADALSDLKATRGSSVEQVTLSHSPTVFEMRLAITSAMRQLAQRLQNSISIERFLDFLGTA